MANTEERSGNLVVQGYIEALGGMGTPLEIQMKTQTGLSEAKNAIQAGTLAGIQALIADMASDARITPSEKKTLYAQWLGIEAEHPIIIDQAEAAGIGATNLYRSDYEDEYDNLYEYLYVLPGIFVDMDLTSDIVALDFQAVFANYYDARQTLIGVIQLKGKGIATWLITEGAVTLIDAITVQKTGGVDGAWDAQAYSLEKFSICAAAFRAHQANLALMVGLNEDPTTSVSYTDLDYAFNLKADGTYSIYVAGAEAFDPAAAYTVNTVFEIDYDGRTVYFVVDGVLIYAAYDPQKAFAVDTSFYGLNARIDNATFSPNAKLPRPAQYLDQIAATPDAASFAPTKIFGDWCFSTTDKLYYRWTGSAWTTSGITTRMKMEGLQDLLGASGAADAVAFMDVLVDRLSARILRLLTTGALVGGDRYDDDGALLDGTAPGFFLPASGVALLASAIFSGSIFSCGPVLSNPGMIWQGSIQNHGANRVYGLDGDGLGTVVACGEYAKVSKSVDGGKTFGTLISNPVPGSVYNVARISGGYIIVGVSGSVSRMMDGESSFGALIDAGFGSDSIYEVIYLGDDIVVCSGANNKISRSTDNGASFTQIASLPFGTETIYDLAYDPVDEILYASSSAGKLSASYDKGLTWSALITTHHIGTANFTELFVSSTGRLYVMAAGGLFEYSDDHGVTWSGLITTPHGTSAIHCMAEHPSGVFVMAGDDGKITRSEDGEAFFEPGSGTSYQPHGASGGFVDLTIDEDTFICCGWTGSAATIITSTWFEAGAGVVQKGYGADGKSKWKLDSTGELTQWGWDWVLSNGTAQTVKTGSFPRPFKPGTLPDFYHSIIGYKSGSNPATKIDRTDLSTNQWSKGGLVVATPNEDFYIGFQSTNVQANTVRFLMSWKAIGEA